jgi:alpha-tubulin suppressor-like RCC1 family protein
VYFWGQGAFAAPADNLLRPQASPTVVLGLPSITAIAAKNRYSVAVDNDGGVWAWDHGSLDVETDRPPPVTDPARVEGLNEVVQVAAGTWQHLAVKADGTVWAWDPSVRQVPAAVVGLADVVAVAIGERHQSALTADGAVWSWGTMWSCGGPGPYVPVGVVQVMERSGARGLAAGYCYTLVFDRQGTVLSLPVVWPISTPYLAPGATTRWGEV